MSLKLTPWYPGHIKPVRPGVYQQMCGHNRDLGYQRWDGKAWSRWAYTAEEVANLSCFLDCNDPWRGLAEDPSQTLST